MEIELLLAIAVASSSFICGFITLITFCRQHRNTATVDKSDLVSARLPSLISLEIILLLWYLMCCTPLMLLFWYYLPIHYNTLSNPNLYNIIGSSIFLISFIPICATHIIRIWLLKLKYNITSLSMLNQLGMIKWKDIRKTVWTKIYYKHKWSHNIKILIFISVIFDVIITVAYVVLLYINIHYRIYLNALIFGLLTLCLIIGVYSLKSFNDPFNIFREEIIILAVWFIALLIYVICYYVLWPFLTAFVWTIAVVFFGAVSALISILIHFYFNNKSIQTAENNLPSLSIIVSTKEGLQTFLKFLVTELSVENLEFFTLSMRWRHRLVLRDQRRAKRNGIKPKVINTQMAQLPFNKRNSDTIAQVSMENGTAQSINAHQIEKLEDISELKTVNTSDLNDLKRITKLTPKSVLTTTTKRILASQNRDSANEAQTHLKQLPFPILTFEFLDRDINNAQKPKRENTKTETSYVLEFSKTKTMLSPQLTMHRRTLTMERNITDRETAVSVFFEQYDLMQNNRRKITELSRPNTGNSNISPTDRTPNNTNTNTKKNKSVTLKVDKSALEEPMSDESLSLKEYDLRNLERGITARSNGNSPGPPLCDMTPQNTYNHNSQNKTLPSLQITPLFTGRLGTDQHAKSLNTDDFVLTEEDAIETELTKTKSTSVSPKIQSVDMPPSVNKQNTLSPILMPDHNCTIVNRLSVISNNNESSHIQPIKTERHKSETQTNKTFTNWFDGSIDIYSQEWTEEFMQSKIVDYDRFLTLSEEINISSGARKNLRRFFKLYSSVKLFRESEICEYDNTFEIAWKNVWENLNDSLRRFHQSRFYKQWLQSNAANGLNVIPMS